MLYFFQNTTRAAKIILLKYFWSGILFHEKINITPENILMVLCSKSHDDRVLFEYTSAIWAHIARGKAECYMDSFSC